MRAAIHLLLIVTCAALASASSKDLVAGPDVRLGDAILAPWPAWSSGASFATNGDETVMVFGAYVGNRDGNLYGVRFDRHGRVLTPVPVLLSPGGWAPTSVQVLWTGGEYAVFFRRNGFFGLRMTAGLQVLSEQRMNWQLGEPITVATDGKEIVAVGSYGGTLERMGTDLTSRGSVRVDGSYGKAVTHGPDGFAVIALGSYERAPVTLQFLRDGVLSAPVRIAEGNNSWDRGGSVSAVWTGTHYAAAWSECVRDSCLVQWKRFSADGTPAAPAHGLEYRATDPRITAIEAATVFVTWRLGETSFGQRWRGDAPLDPEPVLIGEGGAASGMTTQGTLIAVNGAMRIALVPNAVSAPPSDALPLQDLLYAPPLEYFDGAVATDSEIAILRRRQASLVVSILSRDGKPLREVPLAGTAGAIGSDGREFFLVTVDGPMVWFQKLGGERKAISASPFYAQPAMQWNGEAFVVAWHDHPRMRVLRIGRAGELLGARTLQPPDLSGKPSLFPAAGGETLVTWRGLVVRLDAALNLIDEEPIPVAGDRTRCAVSGTTEACVWSVSSNHDRDHRLQIGFRKPGGKFTAVRDITHVTHESSYPAALAPMGERYLVLWNTFITGRVTTRATLLDAGGTVIDEELLHDADASDSMGTQSLLPLSETRVLQIHARSEHTPPFAGITRVFVRALTAPRRRGFSAF